MKRNLFRLFFILLFVEVGFSSCEEKDDDVISGNLYTDYYLTTNYNGYFSDRQIFSLRNISGVDYSRYDVRDVYFVGTLLTITGDLQKGYVVRDLTIDVDGVGTYTFSARPVLSDSHNYVINIDTNQDPYFYDFMLNVVNVLNRYNQLDMIITGRLTSNGNTGVSTTAINIEMDTMLDVHVRD